MTLHEFTIVASGLNPRAADFEQRFLDAGCDDATLSFQKGHIIVDFAREAETFEAAIESAIKDVDAAGARIDRVEPDPLVSLSEIAERAQLTRAAVSQYARGKRSTGFPTPVARVTSDSPLWDWTDVAHWFVRRRMLPIEVAERAEVVKKMNDDLSDRISQKLAS